MSINQLKRQLETAATNKLQILVSRADLTAALAEIDALKAQLAEAKQVNALRLERNNQLAQILCAADDESLTDAAERVKDDLASAEARADAAEKEVERLGEIVTECDGVECIKHDVLVRGAVTDRLAAEAASARMRGVLEKVEAWMADNAVHQLWEDCDIGEYEDEHGGPMDWATTLESVRDLAVPIEYLGMPIGSKPPAVLVLYREILTALDSRA